MKATLETFAMALAEIRRNLLRSLLTTLGIVIGVAAVVAMVTLGQSATAKVTSDISALGNNLLTVRPGAEERGPTTGSTTPFDEGDLRAMERAVGTLGKLSPSATKTVTLVAADENHSTTVMGVSASYLEIRSYALDEGRAFTDAESGRSLCVIGPTVDEALFGSTSAVGETVRVGRVTCEVVGVLESKGAGGFGPDQDDVVLMPFQSFQAKVAGNDDVSTVYVGVTRNEDIGRVTERLQSALRDARGVRADEADDFTVQDMREVAQTFSSVTTILTAFLGAVGAVSLLVGGIGIMNIMLVSVTERTREIGVRLAIGARPRDVLQQFLLEAVVLSLAGGALGVVCGLALSLVGTTVLSLVWSPSPWVVAGAFAFCAVIGVGFGFLPARRAASLDPIQALRHE